MTTTVSHSQISTSKPQKRLFHSLSRFLSGKSRPKLAGTSNNNGRTIKGSSSGTTNSNNINNNNNNNINYNNNFLRDNGDEVPLREVGNRRSTINSFTSSSIGTREERMRGDGASEISGISSLGNSGSRREDDGGADTDASIRPISPGSLAPSSILSRETSASNISYAPTHGTYASTKPTTIFSVESGTGGTGGGTGGANRIAVVPGTGAGGMALPNSLTNHSASPPSISSQQGVNLTSNNSSNPNNPGITFSTLPNTSTTTAFNPNSNSPYNSRLSPGTTDQAPRFTTAHPRNNPHPASPPPDNASMLTLASSSFAPSFAPSRYTSGGGGASLSGLRARVEADEDASVRALAPSRRASDESLGSRSTWSAAIGNSDGRKEVTASLRTVGTGGTGGELLGIGERSSGGAGNASEGLEDVEGAETEAQKVVRTEGGDKMKLDLGERAGEKEIMSEGEHQLTPTGEVDSILPILGVPIASIPHHEVDEPSSNHSEVSTPPSDPTPPTSSLHLPTSSVQETSSEVQ